MRWSDVITLIIEDIHKYLCYKNIEINHVSSENVQSDP